MGVADDVFHKSVNVNFKSLNFIRLCQFCVSNHTNYFSFLIPMHVGYICYALFFSKFLKHAMIWNLLKLK